MDNTRDRVRFSVTLRVSILHYTGSHLRNSGCKQKNEYKGNDVSPCSCHQGLLKDPSEVLVCVLVLATQDLVPDSQVLVLVLATQVLVLEL